MVDEPKKPVDEEPVEPKEPPPEPPSGRRVTEGKRPPKTKENEHKE
jgi:hypothetical protein